MFVLSGRLGQSLRAIKVLWNDWGPVAQIKLSLAAELCKHNEQFPVIQQGRKNNAQLLSSGCSGITGLPPDLNAVGCGMFLVIVPGDWSTYCSQEAVY